MKYIRITIADNYGIKQSQIMQENELVQWFKVNNIWNRVMLDDIKITFSKAKRSSIMKILKS